MAAWPANARRHNQGPGGTHDPQKCAQTPRRCPLGTGTNPCTTSYRMDRAIVCWAQQQKAMSIRLLPRPSRRWVAPHQGSTANTRRHTDECSTGLSRRRCRARRSIAGLRLLQFLRRLQYRLLQWNACPQDSRDPQRHSLLLLFVGRTYQKQHSRNVPSRVSPLPATCGWVPERESGTNRAAD
jgi:hypothetical protein